MGKFIVVEAKHEEKKVENGLVSRQLSRRYRIPDNVLAEQITSSMSSDGVLIVQAPLKDLPERKIQIEYIRQARPEARGQGQEGGGGGG